MKSLYGTLKTESIYHKSYKTRTPARLSIIDYVETFYGMVRFQERLDYSSLEDYEKPRFSA
jgi:transposase InsO family protein